MFNFLFQGKVGEMMAPIKSLEAQLLIAIQNKQQDRVRELLEVQRVDANFANDRGVRPMHMACQAGDMPLVQRLLELGADLMTADNGKNTPLHYAAKGGHVEMVKMLVLQAGGVENRNAARQTAYDVATDHVIRQYLLPIQLKAEAGNPEYAVHTLGITSDTPRNYQQYGAPSAGQHGLTMGQAYDQHDPSSAQRDPMSAALGALMQAPNMAPPRPGGAVAPGFTALPSASGPPPTASAIPSMPPTTPAGSSTGSSPPVPFPGAIPAGPPAQSAFTAPPPASSISVKTSVGESEPGEATPPRQASQPVAVQAASDSAKLSFPGVSVHVQPAAGAVQSPSALPGRTEDAPTKATKASAPSNEVTSATVGESTAAGAEHENQRANEAEPASVVVGNSPVKMEATPIMTTVDLSSSFHAQASVSEGHASPNRVAPLPSSSPRPARAETASESAQGLQAAVSAPPRGSYATGGATGQPVAEKSGKFKLIKPDGFHSSASDKTLQARYGHEKIVRNMGAPPTAAQLGAPGLGNPPMGSAPMGGRPMGGPPAAGSSFAGSPMTRPPQNGGYGVSGGIPGHTTSSGYAAPPGYYRQPFGGTGGMPQQYTGAQPLGHVPTASPGAPHQSVPSEPHFGGHQPTGVSGSGTVPSVTSSLPASTSTSGGGRAGYNVFNPATDRVVSADSYSSAVL